MSDRSLARRYAQALFEVAHEKEILDLVEQELKRIIDYIEASSEMRQFFEQEMISPSGKINVVEEVFGSDISAATMNFLKLVISKRRERYLQEMSEEYMELADEARNKIEVEVTSAVEMTPEQEEKIREHLAAIMNKDVRLKTRIKPELLGGIIIKVGDKVYDQSVKKRLEILEHKLKSVHPEKDRGERAI